MIDVSVTGDAHWTVTVQGIFIMSSGCHHMCERTARLINQARDAPHRRAMSILTEDLGMCEEAAQFILTAMTTGVSHVHH